MIRDFCSFFYTLEIDIVNRIENTVELENHTRKY